MNEILHFLRKNPYGVAAPLLVISSSIAGDLGLPRLVGIALGATGIVAFFIHGYHSICAWRSKRIPYWDAIANACGPIMLVWVVVVFLRAIVLGILGMPL